MFLVVLLIDNKNRIYKLNFTMSIMVNHDALYYDQVHHRDDDIDVSDGGNDELDNEQLQNTIMEKAPPSEKYKIIVCCI